MSRPKGARSAAYDEKRRLLLGRISARLVQRDGARPSLRQLAEAAEVTVPTLRHYFGTRSEIVRAVFQAYREFGEPHLQRESKPTGPLRKSVHDYLTSLAGALMHRGVGEIFAVGLLEGLLHEELGPESLSYIIDPSVDALAARLREHQARGEMAEADVRNAALILIGPVLLACQHQKQLFGARDHPLDVAALIDDLTETFVRSYGRATGADDTKRESGGDGGIRTLDTPYRV